MTISVPQYDSNVIKGLVDVGLEGRFGMGTD